MVDGAKRDRWRHPAVESVRALRAPLGGRGTVQIGGTLSRWVHWMLRCGGELGGSDAQEHIETRHVKVEYRPLLSIGFRLGVA